MCLKLKKAEEELLTRVIDYIICICLDKTEYIGDDAAETMKNDCIMHQ